MKYRLVNENFKSDYGANLLRSRGIVDIEHYMNVGEECLQHWSFLDNANIGVTHIASTIESDIPYAIIVDSDNDGFASSAIIYQYLKELNPNKQIDIYLHEHKQHGLEDHWKKIDEKEYSLIIVPDAGSNDGEYADRLNAPILVLDHHIVETGKQRDNMIIINNQSSKGYLNKDLSGGGVTWQFCRALDEFYGTDRANKYIDLAAWSIISDMMDVRPLENRFIIKKGLSNVNNYFFKTLIDKQGYSMNYKLNPITIAFYIVPLINAMIRVGTMEEKERLFLAFIDGMHLVESHKRGAKGTMEFVAIESARECTNAKTKQDKTKERVVEQLEIKIYKYDLLENQILFIRLDDEDDFPAELNGLVAMNLAARYKKPTVVARLNDEGYIRGSARGVNDSELVSLKEYFDNTGLFEYTAGHDNAHGISILNTNLSALHKKANEELAHIDFGEAYYDINFLRSSTDNDLIDLLYDLCNYEAVWGQHNDEALVCVQNLNLTRDDIKVIGKNYDTVRIEKFGVTYIKFRAKELIEELNKYNEIQMDVIGRPNINEWGGRKTIQLMIDSYEVRNGALVF